MRYKHAKEKESGNSYGSPEAEGFYKICPIYEPFKCPLINDLHLSLIHCPGKADNGRVAKAMKGKAKGLKNVE